MKAKKFFTLVLLALFAVGASCAWGDETVEINSDNFPDKVFRQFVLDELDDGSGSATEGDGILSDSELQRLQISISRWKYPGIESLEGIKYFTRLQTLYCTGQKLTALNVSGLTSLSTLDCSNNTDMTYLNVSGCTSLRYLDCSGNNIKELDLTGLALGTLNCSNNSEINLTIPTIESIRETGNPANYTGMSVLRIAGTPYASGAELTTKILGSALTQLDCSEIVGGGPTKVDLSEAIYVTNINVSNNPNLKAIEWESGNGMYLANVGNVDISGTGIGAQYTLNTLKAGADGTYLSTFKADSMDYALTEIDFTGFSDLGTISLANNSLASVTLPSEMTYGAELNLSNNKLTSVPATTFDKAYRVNLSGNELTTFVWGADSSLGSFATLDLSGNKLTSATLPDTMEYGKLILASNDFETLPTIPLSLDLLDISYNASIDTMPDVTPNAYDFSLNVSGTKIPLSSVPKSVTWLYANEMANNPTTASFRDFTRLHTLYITKNPSLAHLELISSDSSYLSSSEFFASDNALTSVTVYNAGWLDLSNNNLVSVDLISCDNMYDADMTGQTYPGTLDIPFIDGIWLLSIDNVVGSANAANVRDVVGYDSSNTAITPTQNNYAYKFDKAPVKITYRYMTGGLVNYKDPEGESSTKVEVSMDVTIAANPGSAGGTQPTISPSTYSETLTAGVRMTDAVFTATGDNLRWSWSGSLPTGVTGAVAADNMSYTISGAPEASTAGRSFSYVLTATNTATDEFARATINFTVAGSTVEESTQADIEAMSDTAKDAVTSWKVSGTVTDIAATLETLQNLTTLDLTAATITGGALTLTENSSSSLEYINLAGNTTITDVQIENTTLEVLDLSGSSIEELDTDGCTNLAALNLLNCVSLKTLSCVGNSLLTLDLDRTTMGLTSLTEADYSGQTRYDTLLSTDMDLSSELITGSALEEVAAAWSPNNWENISNLKGYDASGNEIQQTQPYDPTTGTVKFASTPARIEYEYDTGFANSDKKMDVKISSSASEGGVGSSSSGCNSQFASGVFALLMLVPVFWKKS